MTKKIIIFSGEPNSINSEIIFKSWRKLNNSIKKKIYFISNFDLLSDQFKKLKYSIDLVKVNNFEKSSLSDNKLKVINVNLNFKNSFAVKDKDTTNYVLNSLNLMHKFALRKDVKGVINCPINKHNLKKKKIGVTEFLANKCKIKNDAEVMLLRNKYLSVCPVTTHIDVKDIKKKLKSKLIIKKINTISNWYKKNLKKKPSFGILGLNPHNAELRPASEEKLVIIPTIKKLKHNGINVQGPLVADTLFINEYKKFDIIVGMYHDQVITPFKTIFKFDAINVTLGLKYLRTSPDHGTAIKLIGKNKANPNSLVECIKFINNSNK